MFFDINYGCTNSGSPNESSSLNTYGYSPVKTSTYLQWIYEIIHERDGVKDRDPSQTDAPDIRKKPFIISITGAPDEVVENYSYICNWAEAYRVPLLVEINLSCPNIEGRPPPAYDGEALCRYFKALETYVDMTRQGRVGTLPLGIKIPPYTHQAEFNTLIDNLHSSSNRRQNPQIIQPIVSFITATNTLGGCLVLNQETGNPALPSASRGGIGGLAGSALHPLALGNVSTLRKMLDNYTRISSIEIIGVGGVSDAAGYSRMRSVGATAVAVGTALGAQGVDVFEKIAKGIPDNLADQND